jgi:dTMP kinase
MTDTNCGRFITFEGGEGAGKTTQLGLLSESLRCAGFPVLLTREPGGSNGAEEIRNLLVTGAIGRWDAISEALLHFAARRDHVETKIKPALEDGTWVLCDRFADSSMAYQGYGYGLGRERIEALQQFSIGEFLPDLTLIFDMPVEAGLARAAGRDEDKSRYEQLDIEFHERVRDGFREIAVAEPKRCIIVDAQDSVVAVQDGLRKAIVDRFDIDLA